jgi:hypothetical protein
MDNGDNDDIPDDLVDNFHDDIIRRRTIARRTNWRLRFTSLSQREVALAASIASSLSDYVQLINAVIVLSQQLFTTIYMMRQHQDWNNVRYKRSLHLYIYYNCMMLFCFFQLDSLVAEEDELLNVRHGEWIPLVETPPRNHSIDELSEENAKSLTWFNKDQLHQLLLHWRIPAVNVTGSQRYRFSGEEVLIISLAKLTTCDPWTCLIPGFLAVMCGVGLQHLDGL